MSIDTQTTLRIIELKETKTWRLLNGLNFDYANAALKFIEHIAPILDTIHSIFPFYTRHDAKHGYQVLKRIESIVSQECYKKSKPISFNAAELLLLICSAYGHDLGMSIFPNEEEQLLSKLGLKQTPDWKKSPILHKYLRDHHSERGGVYINENSNLFNFPTNLIYPLHQLMSSHNWSIQQMESEFTNRTAADYSEIDLKQLSCILCIADAIEFSDNRVIDGVIEQLTGKTAPLLVESYRENMKHFCIQNSVAVGNDGKIIFSGTFQDPEILNVAHRTIDVIEEWIKSYCDIDFASYKKRLKVRSDSISRNLKSLNFDFERLGIRIKKENIINLISSNSTWSNNPATAIRELLQNSVEACRYRKHNTINKDYNPAISIIFDKQNHTVELHDNGCGMSRHTVLNNFLTVGNSRSSEVTYNQNGYIPLARFGIGFWSTFVIADIVEVETAPFEPFERGLLQKDADTGLKFTTSIKEFKDYTVFSKTNRAPGTVIKLHLKSAIIIDDLFTIVSTLLTCSDIPIRIQLGNTIATIPHSIESRGLNQLFGPKSNFLGGIGVKCYTWRQTTSDYDLLIDMYYTKKTHISFLFWGNTLSAAGDLHFSNNMVSICGFKVGINEAPSLFCGHSVASICLNYNSPAGFEYSLNRNTLEQNFKYVEVREMIRDSLHNAFREMLKLENEFAPEVIFRLNDESRRNRGGNLIYFTPNEFKIFCKKYSDLIAFEFTHLQQILEYNKVARIYKTLQQILQEDIEFGQFLSKYILNSRMRQVKAAGWYL